MESTTVVEEAEQQIKRVVIRYGDDVLTLSDGGDKITVGRDAHCDVVINGRYASRKHAEFESRDGAFYVVDISLNGTCVKPEGEEKIYIHQEDYLLYGSGVVCLGKSIKDDKDYWLFYTCEYD